MSDPTLESLRAQGAQHHDPVRFHYLEVLAERLPTQPLAVQQHLSARLQAALADYAARAQAAGRDEPAVAPVPQPLLPDGALSPLAQLNRELYARAQTEAEPGLQDGPAPLREMKSVRRFSEVWAKIAAEQQVTQALTRGPENAGPLNSHRLVLRSLALMRSLSPDYLRHFVAQMDSLLWLEQATAKPPRAPMKPGRSRAKA